MNAPNLSGEIKILLISRGDKIKKFLLFINISSYLIGVSIRALKYKTNE